MAKVVAAVGQGQVTPYAEQLRARLMLRRGMNFAGAAILLGRNPGCDEFVVLNLWMQSVEIMAKALLLLKDYAKYSPKLRNYGHDVARLYRVCLRAYSLNPPRKAMAEELSYLGKLYGWNHLRYASFVDIFIAPESIARDRVLRRAAAVMRLTNRELMKAPPLD